MFPPPRPWKQLVDVDPDREYVGFTSRLFLSSVRRLGAFYAQSQRIMKQTKSASGLVGWSLGANLLTLEFFTLSVWDDAPSLRQFVSSSFHVAAREKFAHDKRQETVSCYFPVLGGDLPLTWKDAVARQEAQRLSGA